MKNFGPIVRAMRHNRTRVVLIVLEIAITLAIVTNCVNVILAERAGMLRTSGFDDENLVRVTALPFAEEFKDPKVIGKVIAADIRALEAIPGVRSAANTNIKLWEGGGSSTGVKPVGESKEPIGTQTYFGTQDLMTTLGGTMAEGRGFEAQDYAMPSQGERVHVVVISKSLADALFPDGHAVGRSIEQAIDATHSIHEPLRVIGVMDRFYNPWGMRGPQSQESIAERVMIEPVGVGGYGGIDYLVRVEPGAMTSFLGEVEKRLLAINPGRVFDFKTMHDKKNEFLADSKIVVTTMTCIIVALVVVTALGLLGLTSLAVAERRKQIGTRRALGATRADIVFHFLVENWLMTTVGLVLGVAGAFGLNILLVSHVSDVKLPLGLVGAGMILLWINGLLSTVPAALKATLVPPWTATRSV